MICVPCSYDFSSYHSRPLHEGVWLRIIFDFCLRACLPRLPRLPACLSACPCTIHCMQVPGSRHAVARFLQELCRRAARRPATSSEPHLRLENLRGRALVLSPPLASTSYQPPVTSHQHQPPVTTSGQIPFRASACAARALNAAGQSRVTLSLLQERLRAACRHEQEEKGAWKCLQNKRWFSQAAHGQGPGGEPQPRALRVPHQVPLLLPGVSPRLALPCKWNTLPCK